MSDWRPYLRERLGPLGLHREREEEILAELAEHLEDQCAAKGEKAHLPDSRVERIESGIDWTLLARNIRHAEEETMSPTAKTLSMANCYFASHMTCNIVTSLSLCY
jgi:hypothetical protein